MIQTELLIRRYGGLMAADDVSLQIGHGQTATTGEGPDDDTAC